MKDWIKKLEKRWTGLRTTSIQTFIENPKYFKQTLDGETKEETPKFFELGTQTHMYILEPEEFKKTYIFLDYDKPKGDNQNNFCEYIANIITKDPNKNKKELCIEAYKKSYKTATSKSEEKITKEAVLLYEKLQDYIKFLTLSDDKQVISYSTVNFLKQAKSSVEKHKLASKLIFEKEFSTEDHYNETFMLWEFPKAMVHGEPLIVKSTLDKTIVDHENKVLKLVDLKTTNNLGEFGDKFHKYNGYKIQLACYWFALETWFRHQFPDKDINEYKRETYLVAIQTPNPYKDYPVNCEVWPISDHSLQEGLNILEDKLPDLAWHFENDLWDHHRSYYEGEGANTAL